MTSRDSFAKVRDWLAEFRAHAEPKSRVVLVGNKVDLVAHAADRREVTTEEGLRLAETENMAFLETSALTGVGVDKAFDLLVNRIYE